MEEENSVSGSRPSEDFTVFTLHFSTALSAVLLTLLHQVWVPFGSTHGLLPNACFWPSLQSLHHVLPLVYSLLHSVSPSWSSVHAPVTLAALSSLEDLPCSIMSMLQHFPSTVSHACFLLGEMSQVLMLLQFRWITFFIATLSFVLSCILCCQQFLTLGSLLSHF